nr:ATP-binding cassette domain-containing protein [Rhodococcus sp. HNM0569]
MSVCGVSVVRQGRALVDRVDFTVRAGEQWAVLGPNGAGKSTLLGLCGARSHPTTGTVDVLGHRLGRVDMRSLRTRIGHVDPRTRIDPWLAVRDVVLTGLVAGAGLPKRWSPGDDEAREADRLVATLGLHERATAAWEVLSQGERGRTLIARALVTDPALLLLDEPTTGLDLAAREILLGVLGELRTIRPELASLQVTHHLEELPAFTDHALVLARGMVVAAGPVDDVLTSEVVSEAFEYPIAVARHANGRWSAAGAAAALA